MRRRHSLLFLTVIAIVTLRARPALAEEDQAAKRRAEREKAEAEAVARSGLQIAPMLVYGFHSTRLRSDAGTSERFGAQGLGFGGRAGWVFVQGFYLGGLLVSHHGEERLTRANGWITGGLWYTGIEAGWQLAAGPLWLRPYGGAGPAGVRLEAPIDGAQVNASGFAAAAWLGGTAAVPIPAISKGFFIGVDARYVTAFGVDYGASVDGPAFAITGGSKY